MDDMIGGKMFRLGIRKFLKMYESEWKNEKALNVEGFEGSFWIGCPYLKLQSFNMTNLVISYILGKNLLYLIFTEGSNIIRNKFYKIFHRNKLKNIS